MPGPFDGLSVVEFGRFIAVPFCGQMLADGGASVVKVEPIVGDETRRNGRIIEGEGRQYLNKNRGKRSLAVDLHHEEARAAVQRLTHRADVVLANFRPGLAAGFALDHASVSKSNPRVIYAENTGYGLRGPMAGEPAMDIAIQAYSGIAQFHPDGPAPQPQPFVDYGAALLLAWGISTALYHRERTGVGQRLDVSLLQAALTLQNNSLNHIDAVDGWRGEFVEYLKTAFAEGQRWADVLERRTAARPSAPARAYYGFHRTADGTMAIAGASLAIRTQIVKVLGVDDRWVTEPGWLPEDGLAHARYVFDQVASALREHPTAYWLERFKQAGVPAAPVRLMEELLDDEQAWANDYFVTLEHELLGAYTVTAPPVKFAETPLAVTSASPVLGKHTREVLREAGLDDAAVDRLAAAGAVREVAP